MHPSHIRSQAPRRPRGIPRGLAALLVALTISVAPAQAGIMDSIGGFFSNAVNSVKGLFGGGKSGGGENAEFEKFLVQVEESQQTLADAQTAVIEYYNANPDSVNLDDSKAQELLNAVADASRTNEDRYLELIKVRAQAQEQKADLSAYQERLDSLQANQQMLEERYQEIQDFNKESGLYTPPPAEGDPIVADAAADGDTGGEKPFDPNSPETKKLIDSWLAANGLDGYGRITGSVNGGSITANYDADTGGRTRHQYVWEEFWNKPGRLNGMTLEQFIKNGAVGGGDPGGGLPPPATQEPTTPTVSDSTADTVVVPATDSPASPTSSQLDAVTKELNQAVADLQQLQSSNIPSRSRHEELLAKIKKLQEQRKALLAAGG